MNLCVTLPLSINYLTHVYAIEYIIKISSPTCLDTLTELHPGILWVKCYSVFCALEDLSMVHEIPAHIPSFYGCYRPGAPNLSGDTGRRQQAFLVPLQGKA